MSTLQNRQRMSEMVTVSHTGYRRAVITKELEEAVWWLLSISWLMNACLMWRQVVIAKSEAGHYINQAFTDTIVFVIVVFIGWRLVTHAHR